MGYLVGPLVENETYSGYHIGMTNKPPQRPADAVVGNWVDTYAPLHLRPYLRLMRADRPVGVWLLLWPCWWAVALATSCTTCGFSALSTVKLMALFAIGAFAMRSAGCIINDIWDRDIDAQVERTAGRPLASGTLSLRAALATLSVMGLIGLAVLMQLNTTTIILGMASLPLVLLYPLAKRITWWPQIFLGLVFNWGALMGWTAVKGGLPGLPSILLYFGCIAWTVGYDTIYAHQDKEDDLIAGVKSSALKLGNKSRAVISLLYTVAITCWLLAGWRAGLGATFYVAMSGAIVHFVWQVRSLKIDDPDNCLRLFRANILFGVIVFASIVLGGSLIL